MHQSSPCPQQQQATGLTWRSGTQLSMLKIRYRCRLQATAEGLRCLPLASRKAHSSRSSAHSCRYSGQSSHFFSSSALDTEEPGSKAFERAGARMRQVLANPIVDQMHVNGGTAIADSIDCQAVNHPPDTRGATLACRFAALLMARCSTSSAKS